MNNPSTLCRECGEEVESFHDLDIEIVAFTLPRLKKFRKDVISYPPSLEFEEWLAILDKIIWSFEKILEKDTDPSFEEQMEEADKIQEGCELFGKYLQMLWS